MGWLRKHLVLILGLLVLVYTFIPIFVVVLMSFNDPDSRLIYRFDGFTLDNWLNPCEDPSMCEALGRSMGPHGFNLGWNLGRVAGAGVVDHVHQHVVPRWGGDTNFMPVLADVKVMPEHLGATREKLLEAWAT